MKNSFPASLLCDFYKVSHKDLYPKGTEVIYSTLTPRSNKYFSQADGVVVFGIQAFIKKYLIKYFNEQFFSRPKEDVVAEYVRVIKFTLGVENPDASHIAELHDLGYLPIRLKALKEGTVSPIKIPVLTIENTDKRFFWLTNYLETILSTEVWTPMTSATMAHQYRKLTDKFAIKTTGSTEGVDFQGHDFSMRGMSSLETAMSSGAGHLLSFTGTDSIPAILYLEEYYNADIEQELVGSSIVATEHSIMSSLTPADGDRDEYEAFKYLITEANPTGFMSIVSDTYDFWKVIGETLPQLKDEIMNRDGRIVIRPDSGIPEDIICGTHIPDLTSAEYPEDNKPEFQIDYFSDMLHDMDLCGDGYTGDDNYTFKFKLNDKYYKMTVDVEYNRHDKRYYYIDGIEMREVKEFTPKMEDLGLIEALWNIFGGTVNEQGYKVLDTHIGAIYGDSITLERAETILTRLEEKGFASTNIVLGIGSYTYQYATRDTLGFALKATYTRINGQEVMLFKDPKTDDGTKRSQRGRVHVHKDRNGGIVFVDGMREGELLGQLAVDPPIDLTNLLETVFENGELIRDQSLSEIRAILQGK